MAYVLDNLKDQGIFERVVEENPQLLKYVPDRFKTREICNAVVMEDALLLRYVTDWFVTQQQVKWDERLIKWYNGYQKCKTQKAKLKEELLPIAWHPSRYWYWCISEAEKREIEKLWG